MAASDVTVFSDEAAPAPRRLTLPEQLRFSVITVPLSALGLALAVYLPPHFAAHLGVPLLVVGGAFTTVRLLDIPVDVFLAGFMDRTKSPWGRYRLWLLAGAPLLTLAVWQLFIAAPRGFSSGYLIGWLLVYYLATSIIGLAHSAWAAKLAPRYDDRSRLFAVLSAVGVLGAIAGIAIPIAGPALGLASAMAVPAMGWLVLALTLPTALIVAMSPEPIEPDVPREPILGDSLGAAMRRAASNLWLFLKDLWLLFTKPDLLRMFAAQMALTLGPGWMSALYLFYFQGPRGFSGSESSILLAIYILAGLVGAPLTGRAAVAFGKHRTLMVTTTAYSVGLMSVVILPVGNVLAAVPVMFWCGAMASGFDLMVRAMLADVGDEVRLESGRERISMIYSVNTLAAKIASAFSIGLTYWVLDRIAFNAADGAVNTPQALHNLELAYIVGPIIFVMLGGACVLGWRLDNATHTAIRQELEARDALVTAGKAPVLETLEGP